MNEATPTPYPDLNTVLKELVENIQKALSENFVGAYLQGSFAVADFDLHSDWDFVIATDGELHDSEVQRLQEVHERIFSMDVAWAKHLEGSYFPKKILKTYPASGGQLWYLNHGSNSLERSDHCNTLIVRWVVREKGITLAGPPPASLVDPIPVSMLRAEILATISDWGEEILSNPEHYNNRFYQTYIALNYCRMLHDLLRGFPGSKRSGADWSKDNLDPSWGSLIDRTWDGRPDPAVTSRQPADPKDFQSTLEFVRYAIARAKIIYDEVSDAP
jgi:hypothetical protein